MAMARSAWASLGGWSDGFWSASICWVYLNNWDGSVAVDERLSLIRSHGGWP
jgi:hypothetical protein